MLKRLKKTESKYKTLFIRGVKIKMKAFSEMFDDNLVDSQVNIKSISSTQQGEKNLIDHKRERD